jgi:RNA polymerase sigma factor (sigma-70 family)
VGDPADAEDAAQSAFVKAYYALARFRVDSPLRPWLLKIVANEARNRRKAATRRPTLSLRSVDDLLVSSSAESPEELVLEQEEQEELLDALECLREEDRQVISHRYFLDLSEGEMAEVLGCPRGTVKSRLSRALERLRVALSSKRDQGVGETFGPGTGGKGTGSE